MAAKNKKPEPLSWKPKCYFKEGLERYCSPACGHDCERAWHDVAQANAQKLAARLGPGWKPRVWENLGWHFSARLDLGLGPTSRYETAAEVYQLGPRDVRLSVVIDGHQFVSTQSTPQKARAAVIARLRSHAQRLDKAAAVLEKS